MRRASAIRLALLACLWGASFLFIKVALRGLSPVQIVLGRLALGAAVLLIVVALRREPLPRSPIVWWHLAVAAVVANIVPYFLFGWGEQRTSSALAGVLNATTPLVHPRIRPGDADRAEDHCRSPGGPAAGVRGCPHGPGSLAGWPWPRFPVRAGGLSARGGLLRRRLYLHAPLPHRPRVPAPGPCGQPAHRR